jgi:pyruvate ferredoxin oxidoreductase gamma subunit
MRSDRRMPAAAGARSVRRVFSVRIHGRGGQGVVTAAELLAGAAFADGLDAQAFPSFGSERMGAPVVAFCRIDHRPIRLREPITEPDAVVVQDPTLLHHVNVFEGLGAEGYILVNSTHSIAELGLSELCARHRAARVVSVPAGELARAHLGRPIPNAALLGALAALTGAVSPGALQQAIRARFAGLAGEGNAAAAQDAFHALKRRGGAQHGAAQHGAEPNDEKQHGAAATHA